MRETTAMWFIVWIAIYHILFFSCCASVLDNHNVRTKRADCRKDEFACTSGDCIQVTDKCNGARDCPDGSDETEAACSNFMCPPYSFKCGYGGCIDNDFICNGVPDCADNYDERSEICANQSQPSRTQDIPPRQQTKVCDPLTPRFQGPPPDSPTNCGMNSLYGIPFTLQGDRAERGQFPWHAAIFKTYDEGGTFENICGGTLISSRLVISAAQCFWDVSNNMLDQPNRFKVALGKLRTSWDEIDTGEKRIDVELIQINCLYRHLETYYNDDIAAVILKETVVFTDTIRPICIEWDFKYRNTNTRGLVAGWGLNSTYHRPSSLRYKLLPIVGIDECWSTVPPNFQNFISKTKFCAGYHNKGVAVCNGDAGGGFIFQEDKWYLRGIVSVGVVNTSTVEQLCSLQDYGIFTNVYEFIPWLQVIFIA